MRIGEPYEHLKRLRIPMTDETRIQPNAKYLASVANQLRLTGANRATRDAALSVTTDGTRLC